MPRLADVPLPYDRRAVKPGIVHFGVGQFCRGHLFYYTHKLLELTASEKSGEKKEPELDFGIIGVNVMKGDHEREMWMDFRRQNCLYSLTRFPHSDDEGKAANSTPPEPETTVIGSMLDYIYAPEELDKVLNTLVDPRIRIVSLTITEGGYNINESSNEFDLTDPAVRADLQNPRQPRSTFGIIVEGLRRRWEASKSASGGDAGKPFTVMSCDNLRNNGDAAHKAILGYAQALDKSLAAWIEQNVTFPNAMVDRITPNTTPEKKKMLQSLPNGISDDEQPVIGEAFSQWVLEDKFVNGARPRWEKVGVEIVDDVAGYEHTKIRILNSSHMFLTYTGLLMGYRTVHESLADPDVRQLVERSLDMDVLPTLNSPMDKYAYKKTIIARFSNVAIADQLLRIAGDGASKLGVFWTSTIVALLARAEERAKKGDSDAGLDNFAFGIAAFLGYLSGKDCKGGVFPVVEPKLTPSNWKSVMQTAGESPATPPFTGDTTKAMLAFNAFDTWRSEPGRAQLEKRIMFYYDTMQRKGVRESIRQLPGWKATSATAKL